MTSDGAASEANESGTAPPSFAARSAELFLLTGFALAQPIFSDLALFPEFFAAHGVHRGELLGLVAALCFAVPLAIAGLGAALTIVSARMAAWAHAAGLGVLLGVAVLQPMGGAAHGEKGAILAVAAALLVSVAATWFCIRFGRGRRGLLFAAPLGLIFPALFLASQTVRPLLASENASPFSGPPIDSETPVVVVVLDELPLASLLDARSEIDRERYPNFAALADEAHWFRNATTVASSTGYAIGSLVTGRRVREPHTARRDNLFTLLSNGNGVLAYEASGENCPPEIFSAHSVRLRFGPRLYALLSDVRVLAAHRLVPRPWRSALPRLDSKWKDFSKQSEKVAATIEFPVEHRDAWRGLDTQPKTRGLASALAALHSGQRPSLLYVHLMLPHRPFSFFPSGTPYNLATSVHGLVDRVWLGTEWETTQALQRHLLQVGYADRLLGILLAELKEVGLYGSAMIVVTSDHGHSFRVGSPDRSLTPQNFADVLSVPLVVKRPGQRAGRIDDRNAEIIDIVPTIAAELGIEPTWPVQGQSLFDAALPARPQKVALRLEFEKYDVPDMNFPTHALAAARDETVARIRTSFGRGNEGLTQVAPNSASADLLGRSVAELDVRNPPKPLRVELPTKSWLATVDATRAPIPAHLIGRLEHPGTSGSHVSRDLAIAIGGRIVATTQTYPGDASWLQFTALLPETSLKTGANEIDVFELDYSSDALSLMRTHIEGYSGAPPLRGGGS